MRYIRTSFAVSLLVITAVPTLSVADVRDVPASANWYFFLDLQKMSSDSASRSFFDLLKKGTFDEMRVAGIDVENELHRVTAFSSVDAGSVMVFEGPFSQTTEDQFMAFVAAGGDLNPLMSSGKAYYHFSGDDNADRDKHISYWSGALNTTIDSPAEEAWVSVALKDRVLVTTGEAQMKKLLASNGKIAGAKKHKGALVVLTAEKALLQAGMITDGLGDDGDSAWKSNILRNTKQVAFLIAVVQGQLAIEAKLTTTDSTMANSMASVVRGLISLAAFDDEMDQEVMTMLQSTKVEADGTNLSISLAVDAELLVATLSD